MRKTLIDACCDACWHGPAEYCKDLVPCLSDGPRCHENESCAAERRNRLTILRRDTVSRPTIFIGTGTCGLGAGAAKTLEAIEA